MYPPLPGDTRVVSRVGVETHEGSPDGIALIGGSPLRLLRLRSGTDAIVASLFGGKSIAETALIHDRSIRVVGTLVRRLLVAGLADPLFDDPIFEGPIFNPGQVTIVIPIRDRASRLERLLQQVTSEHPGVALIVVDDGSTENVAAVANRYGTNVSHIRNVHSLGPAQARNRGLNEVRTPLVAFIDSDVVPAAGWLDPLLRHFTDPAVAVVAPRVRSAAGKGRLYAYERLRSPLDLGAEKGYVFAKTRLAYVPAAVLVARTDTLRTLDGFESAMRVGEDVDLIWRIIDAGHLVRYEPTSVVHHDPRPSVLALAKQRASYASSSPILNSRHRGNVKPVSGNRWSYLAWLLPAVFGASGVGAGAGVVAVTSLLLPRKLTAVKDHRSVGLRLALRGHLGMGRLLASATWRAWLPVALLLAARWPRWRGVLVASALLPVLSDWRKVAMTDRQCGLGPVSFVAFRCLDDASYCVGLWRGCLHARDISALLPEINNWPGTARTGKDDEYGPRI